MPDGITCVFTKICTRKMCPGRSKVLYQVEPNLKFEIVESGAAHVENITQLLFLFYFLAGVSPVTSSKVKLGLLLHFSAVTKNCWHCRSLPWEREEASETSSEKGRERRRVER